MSRTFTKLFSSITESTIWVQDSDVRIVWITMLAMADRHGRVWASIPGLANRARVSVEVTEKALQSFLSPDPYSRTKDFEGRRIEEIDGGWKLLNYEKYRAVRDEEETRARQAAWVKSRRMSTRVDRSRHNAEAEGAEAYTPPYPPQGGACAGGESFYEQFRKAHPRSTGSQAEQAAFMEACGGSGAEARRIIERAGAYGDAARSGEMGHQPARADHWLRDRVFNEDPSLWRRENGKDAKRDRSSRAIQQAAAELAD